MVEDFWVNQALTIAREVDKGFGYVYLKTSNVMIPKYYSWTYKISLLHGSRE